MNDNEDSRLLYTSWIGTDYNGALRFESGGDLTEIEGHEVEAFYGSTVEGRACVFWLKLKERERPYRFFLEFAISCFFEEYSNATMQEELQSALEENELFDAGNVLKVQDRRIQKIYIDADKESFTHINLMMEFDSGQVLKLHDDEHLTDNPDGGSWLYFKDPGDVDFRLILGR